MNKENVNSSNVENVLKCALKVKNKDWLLNKSKSQRKKLPVTI